MIAWLSGVCRAVAEDHVVLDVRGVGYEVFLTAVDLDRALEGEPFVVHIHTVVREDALTLYGFVEGASRELFRLLTSVSGVGPKGALALLGTLSPTEIARSIHDGQPGPLTRAKGIGKRTAELLVVRLRDRLPPELLTGDAPGAAPTPTADAPSPVVLDAISALVHLGYRQPVAQQAVAAAQAEDGAPTELGGLITAALAVLRADGR